MKNKALLIAIVFLILTVLWSMFIWSFSVKDATESTADSDGVVEIVNEVIETVTGKKVDVGDYIVRKLGHFSEFSVLGVLLFMTVHYFGANSIPFRYAFGLGGGLFVSVTDECIQLFSDGRSAQVTDVLLDMSGVFVGFTLSLLVLMLYLQRIKQK